MSYNFKITISFGEIVISITHFYLHYFITQSNITTFYRIQWGNIDYKNLKQIPNVSIYKNIN